MATIGEFGSLLQLGFGVGAGLSVFRSPLDIRVKSISSAINDEIKLAEGIKTDSARERLGDLYSLKLSFDQTKEMLEREQYPFFYATVTGAILNLCGLMIASVQAGFTLSTFQICAILYVSVFHYIAIGLALEFLARSNFRHISESLRKIRGE